MLANYFEQNKYFVLWLNWHSFKKNLNSVARFFELLITIANIYKKLYKEEVLLIKKATAGLLQRVGRVLWLWATKPRQWRSDAWRRGAGQRPTGAPSISAANSRRRGRVWPRSGGAIGSCLKTGQHSNILTIRKVRNNNTRMLDT